MCHELRNPLHVLKATVASLLERDVDTAGADSETPAGAVRRFMPRNPSTSTGEHPGHPFLRLHAIT